MRTLALLLPLLIGCQSRPDGNSPSTGAKTVEATDDDFLVTRAAFQRESRARLARINARIADIGEGVTTRMRAERDELALEIEKIDDQGESAFDSFRSELDKGFDAVERELGFH